MNYIPSELWKHLPSINIEYLCVFGFILQGGPLPVMNWSFNPIYVRLYLQLPIDFRPFLQTPCHEPSQKMGQFVCLRLPGANVDPQVKAFTTEITTEQAGCESPGKTAGSFWCWRCHEIRQKGVEKTITPRSPKTIILLGTYHQQFQGTIWFLTSRDHPFLKGLLLKI